MVLSISDPPRMEQYRNHMAARILDLTLEIIYWITGEDHTVVKTSSGECVTPRVSRGRSRAPSDITEPPPRLLIHEQEILELTHKITDLLSGEVPIRCLDFSVYFSMEEWEYLEGHKDQYKDVMMQDHPSITSWVVQDKTVEIEMKASNGHHHLSPGCEVNNNNTSQRNSKIPDLPVVLHNRDLSPDTAGHMKPSSSQLLISKQRTRNTQEKIFPHEKNSKNKSNLSLHERIHKPTMPFSCSECGKYFRKKTNLMEHVRIHTGEKPYSCSECGKRFIRKQDLMTHLRRHTGEKPFSCSKGGKNVSRKTILDKHQRTHTGEKPFSCPECGKFFTRKSYLSIHLRIHTGEKPFSCSHCGKCFNQKSHLVKHLTTH